MEKNNYSMYTYYKGSDTYPNKKAKFFGFYEQSFELTYKGTAADKDELFKDYMNLLLYEQASEDCHFGEKGVDIDKCFEDYYRVYSEPEYKAELYNN
jgi:hypothetical protein